MIIVPGRAGKDLCDADLGVTRRDILRVGGSGLLGLGLGSMLELQAASARGAEVSRGPGWGRAKSIIMVYLQGGPSHLDLWDPKDNVPDNVRSVFKPIDTKVPGVKFTEILPKLSQVTDKLTLIRSMSYTPNGLFNHTAAIYQMMTGYTTDKVSPSGQLEPPNAKDFPNFGSQIIRLRPQDVPMLPFVMLPRPLQESNVVGKGGTAGFLGKAFDPYTLFPDGDDMDMAKMDRIKVDDLKLRPEVFAVRLQRRAKLREAFNAGMRDIDQAVADLKLNEYYDRALSLIVSGRAREAFDLQAESAETRDLYGRNTFGQSCLLARRLVEAGTKVVEVIWPKVANSDNHSWDHHSDLTNRMRDRSGPMLDQGLSGLLTDMDRRGLLDETLVVLLSEHGRTPKLSLGNGGGRDHWSRCYSVVMAGGGIARGQVVGQSDRIASDPAERPVSPKDILATIYHLLGIDPQTMLADVQGRPIPLIPNGEVIPEALA